MLSIPTAPSKIASKPSLLEFPHEVLLRILSHLSPLQSPEMKLVSNLFHALSQDPSLKILIAASGNEKIFLSLDIKNKGKAFYVAVKH